MDYNSFWRRSDQVGNCSPNSIVGHAHGQLLDVAMKQLYGYNELTAVEPCEGATVLLFYGQKDPHMVLAKLSPGLTT